MRGDPTARTAPSAVPGPGIFHFPGTVPAALRSARPGVGSSSCTIGAYEFYPYRRGPKRAKAGGPCWGDRDAAASHDQLVRPNLAIRRATRCGAGATPAAYLRPSYVAWADLLRRVFTLGILACYPASRGAGSDLDNC